MKERLLACLFAFFTGYYLIANYSIYKSFVVVAIVFILITIGFITIGKKYKTKSLREPALYFFAWSFVYLWAYIVNGDSIGFGYITILVFCTLFLSLSLDYQLTIVKFFIWGISFLYLCSLVEYVIYLTTDNCYVLQNVERITTTKVTSFSHLVFNLIRISDYTLRFQGLADEPGRIGTLCGMLIFLVRRLTMNKLPLYIFIISGLLSYSLAFFILFVIFLLSSVQMNFKRSIVMIGIVSIVLWLVQDKFNEKIIERISDTENIDNRTQEVFDSYFSAAVNSGQIWFGLGSDYLAKISEFSEEGDGNGGAKVFLLQYGIICFILLFLMYNYLYIKQCKGKVEKYDWLFLLAFWLSFYQRQTIFFPFTMMTFFSMSIAKFDRPSTIK